MDEQEAPPEINAPEPIAPETAEAWLLALPSDAVLTLLRQPDFAVLGRNAFVGFRINRGSYSNPLVRRRLAHEITQNSDLAKRIQVLAEGIGPPAPNSGGDRLSSPVPPNLGARWPLSPPLSEGGSSQREEALKAERDRLRKERDAARDALHHAEASRANAEASRANAEAAQALADKAFVEQSKLVQQQTQRIVRLERQVAKLQTEQTQLLKTLRPEKASKARPTPPPATTTAEVKTENAWRRAVAHLIHKNKHEIALSLALDVLRADHADFAALDIAAQAYVYKGLTHEAGEMVRRSLSLRLARAEIGPASDALMRLLTLLANPAEAGRDVRQWLTQLRSEEAIAAAHVAVERLRGPAPLAHAWLESQVRAVRPALADALMPPPGTLGTDDPLPLPASFSGKWSARYLIDAVNANQEHIVTEARKRLGQLDTETSQRVWDALTRAAGEDDTSVLVPLRRAPHGPAVVDGSNAAWFDQSSYAAPRARLRPLLALRRALHLRGYFPVFLYADAPLPHTIDDPQALRVLLDRREIAIVDRGVDADEVLLREAKRCNAPLITNDYMTDWDPQNEVEKIQYTISHNGEAHLLS